MLWLWISVGVLVVVLLVSWARKRKQRATVTEFRTHFPHIARLRLVAACRGLDGLLQESDLRMLFDWILLQLYGRTQTSDFGELIRWTIEQGEGEALQLVAEVTRDAVDRLPAPVLAVIDDCEGRTVAGVILDQALSESGKRMKSARAQAA
ncbi:MAG TPA: hypothetical protein VFH89_04665 [Sphingomicrobium sp.]|nr:hypothetical protein [Sphingomicrobium sp.]